MDKCRGDQGCLDLDHFCRLTSIELHLDPHRVPKDSPAERADSWLRQARAPSYTESLHPVLNCHLLLSHHMPLTGCALGKHGEFPSGCELVDHVAGLTETEHYQHWEHANTCITHACTSAVTHLTPFLLCRDKQMKEKMLYNQALGVCKDDNETSWSTWEWQK